MKTSIGILGSSGMAREAGDIVDALGHQPIYFARDREEIRQWTHSDEITVESEASRYPEMRFVIGVGDNSIRERVFHRFENTLQFTNLIHPSATFGRGQRVALSQSQGLVIAAGARFTSNITVGNFCIINQNVTVAHDCIVGDFVHLAPSATLSGAVCIERSVWIGANAVVLQGSPARHLRIGARTTIGAGAVVLRDCEEDATYVGNPARRIR